MPSESGRKIKTDSDDEECGIGPLVSPCLQKCVSIWTFLAIVILYSMVHGLMGTFGMATLTTLEKQFQFPSSKAGALITMAAIGHNIAVLFVSYYGTKVHRARLFAVACLLSSLAAFLCALPHFIYGAPSMTMEHDHDLHATTDADESSITVNSGGQNKQLCAPNSSAIFHNIVHSNETCSNRPDDPYQNFNLVAFSLFTLGELLHGFAGSPLWPIGITTIDDYVDKDKASTLTGVLMGLRFITPVISFGLAAWILTFPVDLRASSLHPRHPRWIGAWWLGYVSFGVLFLLFTISFLMMPRQFPKVKKKDDQTDPEGKGFELNQRNDLEDKNKNDKSGQSQQLPPLKDLPKAIVRLCGNSIFILAITACCVGVFEFGYFGFLAKYIEVQFKQPTFIASLMAGAVIGLIGAISAFSSGFLASRLKLTLPVTCARWCTICSFISTALFGILFALGCSEVPFGGRLQNNRLNVITVCNSNCSCVPNQFDPVCGHDGVTYFSPCHAGCVGAIPASAGFPNKTYVGCSCVETGVATEGYCANPCDKTISFVVVLMFSYFFANLGNVPLINMIMRCVEPRDRSLSIAAFLFLMGIIVFPAPILFGNLIDSTCIAPMVSSSSQQCGITAKRQGACQLYDVEAFRINLHMVAIIIKLSSVTLFVLTWLRARYLHRKSKTLKVVELWRKERQKDGRLFINPTEQNTNSKADDRIANTLPDIEIFNQLRESTL